MEAQKLSEALKNQKVEMSPEERIHAYLKGEEVDHIPYAMLGEDPAIAEIYGLTTSQVGADFERQVYVTEKKRSEFGLSGINVGLGLRTLGECLGSELVYPIHGTDYVKTYILEDYENIGCLKLENPRNNPVMKSMIEYAHKMKERFPDMDLSTGAAGPITTISAIRPIEKILRDTVKNPEKLHGLLKLSVEYTLEWIRLFKEEFGKTGVGISDPVTCMNMLSKKQFRLDDGSTDIDSLDAFEYSIERDFTGTHYHRVIGGI